MKKQINKEDRRFGKLFLKFAGICIIVLPWVVSAAFSFESGDEGAAVAETRSGSIDRNEDPILIDYDQISRDYLEGMSSERTLDKYYSRRQYPGSPPLIPHKVEEADSAVVDCLACHEKGGWTPELKKHTPITPHPEQEACRQCHVVETDAEQFVTIDWISVKPPRLGRAALPGAPPPIPHELQMRDDCNACHVGPAAVNVIRVEHPIRGDCRQCHVPDAYGEPFKREPD